MDKLGITGMTVTKVLGYGLQKGNTEYLPRCGSKRASAAQGQSRTCCFGYSCGCGGAAAKKMLYTGKYGDGKNFFIYDVENVVKIRTGEEGYEALQDEPIEA